MSIILARSWRWRPARYQTNDPKAPYRVIVHIGCWLVFCGRNKA